ncbi:hypothetical protein [Streptomyces sp. NBC_01445]|uniref:hypothetical protein n=1 Tax=Streptomyces sp. NBC_01445 TaxID=2903869 RepID=UPI003FA3CE3A
MRRRLAREPARALALPLDVTSPDAARAAVDVALARFGRIDVLVAVRGHRRGLRAGLNA